MSFRLALVIWVFLYSNILSASDGEDRDREEFLSTVAQLEADPFDLDVLGKTKQKILSLEACMKSGEVVKVENFQLVIRVHYVLRSYKTATQVGEKLAKALPDDALSREITAKSYFYRGEFNKAIDAQNQLIECLGTQQGKDLNMAFLYGLIYMAYEGKANDDVFCSLYSIDDPYLKLHLAYVLYMLDEDAWVPIVDGLHDAELPEYIDFMGEFNVHQWYIRQGAAVMDLLFGQVKILTSKHFTANRVATFLAYHGTAVEDLLQFAFPLVKEPSKAVTSVLASDDNISVLVNNIVRCNVRPALRHLMALTSEKGDDYLKKVLIVLQTTYSKAEDYLKAVLLDSLLYEASQVTKKPVGDIIALIYKK